MAQADGGGRTVRSGRDVLVVGAGSAGATLAARLSEDPGCQVTLLEAGPDYRGADAPPEMRSGHWTLILDPETFPAYQWPSLRARRAPGRVPELYWRGRGVGGSSAINGQVAIRPPLEDFDRWAELAGPAWGPERVLGSFIALEDDLAYGDRPWHGRGGPIPISRAPHEQWGDLDRAFAAAFGAHGNAWTPDCNEPATTGVSILPYNARDGVRVSTNDGYLDPARARPNLEIIGDALVDRVVFEGRRAIGVTARVARELVVMHADEIVVAAGAVHTPAILQRSGVGPSAHLRTLGIDVVADVPAGQGFQEHPHVYFGFGVPTDLSEPANGRHTNACVRWTSGERATGANDLMAIVNGPAPGMAGTAGLGLWVNQPFSRGSVQIHSRDPEVDPLVDMALADDERDRARLRLLVEVAAQVLGHEAFVAMRRSGAAGIDGTSLDELRGGRGLDAWIDRVVDGSAHASSTCALGTVVDEVGQVHGVERLRVVDLSIAPSVPRANTNLTAIMIGEHAARLMQGTVAAGDGFDGSR